jgi:TRAP-type transport system small permease protein
MTLIQIQSGLAELGRWVEKALLVACGVLLCVMASSVFFEVVMRFLVRAPTGWTEELAQFALVWYGMLAAAVGARKGLHFAIRWGVMGFGPQKRWLIRQGVNVAVIVFLCTLLRQGIGYLDVVANQISTGAGINMRIPWAAIPAGVGAMLLMYLLELADAVLSIRTGRRFSEKEVREEAIQRALRGETGALAAAEALPPDGAD